MSTLYKRAPPSQARILRAVAGAVKNVGDSHPEYGLNEYMARSIAKRACGTLTAQWPDVLAAKSVKGFSASDRDGVLTSLRRRPGGSQLTKGRPADLHAATGQQRGASQIVRRSPLSPVYRELGIMAGQARRAGDTARLEALADALRVVARFSAAPKQPGET